MQEVDSSTHNETHDGPKWVWMQNNPLKDSSTSQMLCVRRPQEWSKVLYKTAHTWMKETLGFMECMLFSGIKYNQHQAENNPYVKKINASQAVIQLE